ncbi:hypothetical protein V4V36_04175 [Paenibacillus lautus]|uniref:hypothetical protein n=1 Tax=Paenibacillus lautus TaxID=1401 RepID=UPI002FBD3FE1
MCYGVKLVISQNNESPAATNRSMGLASPYNDDIPMQEDGRDVIGQLDLAQACRMDVRQIPQSILPT